MIAQRTNTYHKTNITVTLSYRMARRGLLSTADVLEELELDQGDFDADEPMMLGSDDEFDDVYLDNLEDEDDEDDNRDCYSPLPVIHQALA